MATFAEEITAKLGFDTSAWGQGVRQVKGEAAEMGEHAHHSFIHAKSGAREFHRVIKDIAKDSPLMGAAVEFALSPAVAILVGVMEVFNHFKKEIEEWNKEMDKMQEKLAKPIGDMGKSLKDASMAAAEAKEQFRSWREGEGKPGDEEARQLKEKIELIRRQTLGNDELFHKKKAAAEEEAKVAAEERAAAALRKADQIAETKFSQERIAVLKDMPLRMKSYEDAVERANEAQGKQGDKLEAARKALADAMNPNSGMARMAGPELQKQVSEEEAKYAQTLKDTATAKSNLKKIEEHEIELKVEDKKITEELKRAQQDHDQAVTASKNLQESIGGDETKAEEAAFKDREKEEKEAARDAKKKAAMQLRVDKLEEQRAKDVAEENLSPFRSSLQEIANSRKWIMPGWSIQTQQSKDAAELIKKEKDAKDALLFEGKDSSRFKDDLKRISELKEALKDAGQIAPDKKLESIDDRLADLVEAATVDGMKVDPVMGD